MMGTNSSISNLVSAQSGMGIAMSHWCFVFYQLPSNSENLFFGKASRMSAGKTSTATANETPSEEQINISKDVNQLQSEPNRLASDCKYFELYRESTDIFFRTPIGTSHFVRYDSNCYFNTFDQTPLSWMALTWQRTFHSRQGEQPAFTAGGILDSLFKAWLENFFQQLACYPGSASEPRVATPAKGIEINDNLALFDSLILFCAFNSAKWDPQLQGFLNNLGIYVVKFEGSFWEFEDLDLHWA